MPHRDAVAPHLGLADRLEAEPLLIHAREAAVAGERPHARVSGGEAGGAQLHPALLPALDRQARDAVVPADPEGAATAREQVVGAAARGIAVTNALGAGDLAAARVDAHEQRQV